MTVRKLISAFSVCIAGATCMTACTTTTIRSSRTGWQVPHAKKTRTPKSGREEVSFVSSKTKTTVANPEKIVLAPAETVALVPQAGSQPAVTQPASTQPDLTPATTSEPAAKRAHSEAHLIFDFPVTYNSRVRKWIKYFQTSGRPTFRRWLERSSRYIPGIQAEMRQANLPQDLAYVAMIESGFSSSASSHASAIGMWQFIAPTGRRYGLEYDWWIDERRDFEKSTKAAIGYMKDLFEQFGSWYLVAASYNMGENGVRRLINRYKTNSFWDLADRGALPEETRDYLPKMLAAMLIAKAPALYGFRGLEFQAPYSYDSLNVPGGTDLINLANHLGVSERALTELNPELLKAFIPREVKTHRIRIPKGSKIAVSQYVNNPVRTIQ